MATNLLQKLNISKSPKDAIYYMYICIPFTYIHLSNITLWAFIQYLCDALVSDRQTLYFHIKSKDGQS